MGAGGTRLGYGGKIKKYTLKEAEEIKKIAYEYVSWVYEQPISEVDMERKKKLLKDMKKYNGIFKDEIRKLDGVLFCDERMLEIRAKKG